MITINNKSYIGKSVTIRGNKLIVDGVDVTPDSKKIDITVDGNIDALQVDYAEKIIINGDVNKVITTSGDVDCKNVKGDIKTTSGDVECNDVQGSITTNSGDIECGNVGGSVRTTSGDIKTKK